VIVSVLKKQKIWIQAMLKIMEEKKLCWNCDIL
jgi:hypothetical protein